MEEYSSNLAQIQNSLAAIALPSSKFFPQLHKHYRASDPSGGDQFINTSAVAIDGPPVVHIHVSPNVLPYEFTYEHLDYRT